MEAIKTQTQNQAELRREAERYLPGGVGGAGRINSASVWQQIVRSLGLTARLSTLLLR